MTRTPEEQLSRDALERVESMVTAVLADDALAQLEVMDGLTLGEAYYVKAGASIIAGLMEALGNASSFGDGRAAWAAHLPRIAAARAARDADHG